MIFIVTYIPVDDVRSVAVLLRGQTIHTSVRIKVQPCGDTPMVILNWTVLGRKIGMNVNPVVINENCVTTDKL
jgi:hypothetical protein